MDNTTLHYLTYDPEAIWEEMLAIYMAAGGEILYPGDEKEMLLRSVLADITQVFAAVDNALRMQTLRFAVGEYLDVLGEQRSCERIKASAAEVTVTIQTNATGRSSTLEAGTAMTADGVVFYLLKEDLTLTGSVQTLTAQAVADREGSAGNSLTEGTALHMAVTNAAVSSITAATDAAGGNEAEDDETYRARIREYGLVSVSTGPARQYEAAAKAVSSAILDAKALNLGAGQVGVYLILADGTSAAGVLQAVTAALSADSVRPLTDQVSVAQATNVAYTLNVKYSAENASGTSAAIAEAVSSYQEWQDNVIGRAFNPDRLMAALYRAGATRVLWDTGSAFNGGSVAYTEIGSAQRCKGTINLTEITE